jgi:mgtE-like transporter
MRGVIGGLFSGSLSTGLHLGTISLKVFGKNTKRLHSLWSSIIVLTFESSVLLGIVSLLFGTLLFKITAPTALTIFGVLIATMGLSLLLISPMTLAIAFSAFGKGLDPDVVVYPIQSTIADILVTLCYALVLSMLFFWDVGWLIVLGICIGFMSIASITFYENRKEPEFIKTIKETIYTTVLVAFIVNITGSILHEIVEFVGQRPEIFAVYPALINVVGDVGAIVGSTATTKLALGTLNSSFRSIKNHKNQIIGVWSASLVVYTMLALIASFYQLPFNLPSTLRFIGLLLATNLYAAFFMILISFSVAILTFHKGLDPDNFVIPVESSLADTITTVSLWVMLNLIGGF